MIKQVDLCMLTIPLMFVKICLLNLSRWRCLSKRCLSFLALPPPHTRIINALTYGRTSMSCIRTLSTHLFKKVNSEITTFPSIMLLSHSGEDGGEWAYECNSSPIRNDHKVISRHSCVFVSIRGHSWGVANKNKFRSMFLNSWRIAYSHCFRKQS
jgi:hypothetical protein